MRYLILLWSLFPVLALADESCFETLSPGSVLDLTYSNNDYVRRLPLAQVFVPRASKPATMIDLELTNWLEFERHGRNVSLLGISKSGTLYHIIQIGSQKAVARRLGAQRVYTEFALTQTSDLIAVDEFGKAYLYQAPRWRSSGFSRIEAKNTEVSALLAFTAVTILNAFQEGPMHFLDSLFAPSIYDAAVSLAAIAGVSVYSALKYEKALFPESFVELRWRPDSGLPLRKSVINDIRKPSDLSLHVFQGPKE